MNGYKCFYLRRSTDIYADSLYAAKLAAIAYFKVPRNREHMVSVMLCEVNGQPVETHIALL